MPSSLLGLAGQTGFDGAGTLSTWGTPLLLAAVVLVLARLVQLGQVPARVASLTVMLAVFWCSTAIGAHLALALGNPYASRYIYVGALLAVLLAVELARGWSPGRLASGGMAVLALAAIASNVGAVRTAGALLRNLGQTTTADLGALEIGRPLIPAGYIAHGLPGYPLVSVPSRQFFAITRAWGNPAADLARIEADPESVRETVDAELIAIHQVSLAPGSAAPGSLAPGAAAPGAAAPGSAAPGSLAPGAAAPGAAAPGSAAPRSLAPGSAAPGRACARWTPPAFQPSTRSATLRLTLPAAGIVVRAGAASVAVSLRRFASSFQALGTLAAQATATLRIAPDLAGVAWHVQLSSTAPLVACSG